MADAATIMDDNIDTGTVDTGTPPPDTGAVDTGTPAPPDTGTVDTGTPALDQGQPRAFGDNWREELAGEDPKLLKELQRYTSPQALLKSWKDLRTKISSGQYKTTLPEGATEEEVAQWRTENGIPASPDDYKVELGDGMVLGEEDQALVQDFLKHAHGENLPESAVNAALRWYVKFNEANQDKAYAEDVQYKESSLAALRESWGPDFKANLNAVKTLVGDAGDYLFAARGPDGRLLGDNPQILDMLANAARQVYPAITVIPGGGHANMDTVESELANLRKMMGNPASDYWKGPKSQGLQDRYKALLEAREKLKDR